MAQPAYPWNPFQDLIDSNIAGEIIKPATENNRMEFVPRAAPFFAKDFKLYKQGSNTPLVFGQDYVFAHPFDAFIDTYKRNVFGSVVLLKKVTGALYADYGTIGTPFVLDDVAFATLVANIMNSPRQVDWSKLSNVPTEFPSDPHPHPMVQTYDYYDMMVMLRSLINAISYTSNGQTIQGLLEEHIGKRLIEAHKADNSDLGMDLVENAGLASSADLNGNSANSIMTVATFKEGLRKFSAGQLNID